MLTHIYIFYWTQCIEIVTSKFAALSKWNSSVIDLSAWRRRAATPSMRTFRLIRRFLIDTEPVKNTHGNSRRRLLFLPDSVGAHRHKGATECKCPLSKARTGSRLNSSWFVGVSVSPPPGSARVRRCCVSRTSNRGLLTITSLLPGLTLTTARVSRGTTCSSVHFGSLKSATFTA